MQQSAVPHPERRDDARPRWLDILQRAFGDGLLGFTLAGLISVLPLAAHRDGQWTEVGQIGVAIAFAIAGALWGYARTRIPPKG